MSNLEFSDGLRPCGVLPGWRVRAARWLALLWLAGSAATASAFEDSMAQRLLACSACHGVQGRAGPDGYYPRIAGKPAGYLLHQLHNFRNGRRHYALMGRLLEPLSDAYLQQIADYFAGLELPYPPPPATLVDAATLARGQRLVRQGSATPLIPPCTQCHGKALTGVAPDIPGLLGLPRDYLNAQLGAWRTGQRRATSPDCMAHVARQLDSDDLWAVTSWLAAQPLPQSTRPAAELPPLPPGAAAVPCGSVHQLKALP